MHAVASIYGIPHDVNYDQWEEKTDSSFPEKIGYGTSMCLFNTTDLLFTLPADIISFPVVIFIPKEEPSPCDGINHFKIWDHKNMPSFMEVQMGRI